MSIRLRSGQSPSPGATSDPDIHDYELTNYVQELLEYFETLNNTSRQEIFKQILDLTAAQRRAGAWLLIIIVGAWGFWISLTVFAVTRFSIGAAVLTSLVVLILAIAVTWQQLVTNARVWLRLANPPVSPEIIAEDPDSTGPLAPYVNLRSVKFVFYKFGYGGFTAVGVMQVLLAFGLSSNNWFLLLSAAVLSLASWVWLYRAYLYWSLRPIVCNPKSGQLHLFNTRRLIPWWIPGSPPDMYSLSMIEFVTPDQTILHVWFDCNELTFDDPNDRPAERRRSWAMRREVNDGKRHVYDVVDVEILRNIGSRFRSNTQRQQATTNDLLRRQNELLEEANRQRALLLKQGDETNALLREIREAFRGSAKPDVTVTAQFPPVVRSVVLTKDDDSHDELS